MKKQAIRVLCLVLCLMFACSIPFASAAEKMPTGIISCFDLETDYMARTILNQIKPTGSHKEKIRAVYDWIIRNCDRQGSESTHPAKFTDAQITKGATALEKEYTKLLEQGKLIYRSSAISIPEDQLYACGSADYSLDSNYYMSAYAYHMLRYRYGNCVHYTALLNTMLGLMGYEAHMIGGYFVNYDGSKAEHKWSYVMVEGEYYWLDVRMDHATYVRTGNIDYRFFMVKDTAKWATNHEWDHKYSDALYRNRRQQTQGLHAYGTHFWDTIGHWGKNAIEQCYEKKYFNGITASTFEPNSPMTRAMLVTVLYRLDGQSKTYKPNFSDVKKGKWFSSPIGWAQQNNIVNGVSDTRFAPDDSITREQTATILYRYALSKGYDTSKRGDLTKFKDQDKVSKYAAEALSWAMGVGIINGKGKGILDPQGKATRAELAKMLTVFDKKY